MRLDEEGVQQAWNRNAPVWVERVRAGRDLYREVFNNPAFMAFLPPLAGLDVLDLGCGEGTNTRIVAQTGARLTGVDIAPAMIEAARAEEVRAPLGISYEIASFSDLSRFPDGSFGAAISTMALMDCPDFGAAAREVHRLLKPGSSFTFSVLHPCFVTPGLKWTKDESGREIGLMVGRYFDDTPFVERWRFSRDPDAPAIPLYEVPRFPRRLETYVSELLAAGLQIRALKEPRPTEDMAEAHSWLRRWRDHAAIFLYLSAEKPKATV